MPLSPSAREAQHRSYLKNRNRITERMRIAKQDARKAELLRFKNNPEALREYKAEQSYKHQAYMKNKIDNHLQVMLKRGYPEVINKFIREVLVPYPDNLGVSFINKIVVIADELKRKAKSDNNGDITILRLHRSTEAGSPLKEGEDYEVPETEARAETLQEGRDYETLH